MMEVSHGLEVVNTNINTTEEMHENIPHGFKIEGSTKSKGRKQKRRRRPRNRPYSAKNFLGRPKINAPANTTQFICEDKEGDLGLDKLFNNKSCSSLPGCTSNSESECSLNTSSSTVPPSPASELQRDNYYYLGDMSDNDRFLTEDFERMYNDVRSELLRSESVEVLSSRCIELESAIHNLEYLLQKETEKRQQMEEIIFLMRANAELVEENNRLRQMELARELSENLPAALSSPIGSPESASINA